MNLFLQEFQRLPAAAGDIYSRLKNIGLHAVATRGREHSLKGIDFDIPFADDCGSDVILLMCCCCLIVMKGNLRITRHIDKIIFQICQNAPNA